MDDPRDFDDEQDDTPATGTTIPPAAVARVWTRPVVIVDIDGTIANNDHRKHLAPHRPRATEADWRMFNDDCDRDEPIANMIEAIRGMSHCAEIVFVTSRPERVRAKTEAWLCRAFGCEHPAGELFMRPDGDNRPASIVKLELATSAGLVPRRVLCCLEDDARVSQAWRMAGYVVLQVHVAG